MKWRIVATRSQAELYCAGELVGTLYDFIHPAEMIIFAAILGAGGMDSPLVDSFDRLEGER